MKKLLILIFLIIIYGCAKENNVEFEDIVEIEDKFNEPPTLYNIGINLDRWNKETNMGGDVLFKKYKYDDKLFIEYGGELGGKNVHPEFYLPVGSKVFSSTNGIIGAISYIEPTNDYAVLITRGEGDKFTVNYEHVVNVIVKEGDEIKAGDLIGEVSPRHEGFGITAIMIFRHEDHMTYCPYDLLHESVKETYENKIMQHVKDWEEFTGENIYDEETWYSPGCKYKMFLESESKTI